MTYSVSYIQYSMINIKGNEMSDLKNLVIHEARPLPVIILADASGSMHADNNIGVLNNSIREMIDSLKEEQSLRAEVNIAVIVFGDNESKIHLPFTKASEIEWNDVVASGRTPMGDAFVKVQNLIEDKSIIPSRAYAPTIVLLSDGKPTDNWEEALSNLLVSPRAAKAMRMAMSIGGTKEDNKVLKEFLGDSELSVFEANQAREITKFFRFVTMSVAQRVQSVNPNQPITIDIDDFEEDFDDFEL